MTKQLLNRGQQSCPLCLSLWSEVKGERLKRPLCLLYICLQGVFFCGALEATPTIPNNIRLKGDDCGQVPVVVLINDDGRGLAAGGQPEQSIRERGAKCGTSYSNAACAVIAPSNKPGERGKQDGTKNSVGIKEEGFDHWFWIYVVFAL